MESVCVCGVVEMRKRRQRSIAVETGRLAARDATAAAAGAGCVVLLVLILLLLLLSLLRAQDVVVGD